MRAQRIWMRSSFHSVRITAAASASVAGRRCGSRHARIAALSEGGAIGIAPAACSDSLARTMSCASQAQTRSAPSSCRKASARGHDSQPE